MNRFFLPFCLSAAALLSPLHAADSGNGNPGDALISGIGAITNPSGDCQIAGSVTRLTMTIPAGEHLLDIELDKMTAPRVLQEVTGDFTAQVTVSGSYPLNTSTNLADHRPFQGAGLLLFVSPQSYIRLERAQVNFKEGDETKHASYASWELRLESKPLRMGGAAGLTGKSTTLRLSRIGNSVHGAISEDGTTWQELDPFTLKLPEKVQIGIVGVQDTTSGFEATFENFTCKPIEKAAN